MKIHKLNGFAYSYSILTIFWTTLLIALPFNTNASVSPPRIKIEAKPRDKVAFNLEVKNKNNSPREYHISYSYYVQDKDGFQKENKLEQEFQEGPWNWIDLDSSETFNINGNQSLPIEGTIKIPSRNSYGFHNILITVTEITPMKKTGVTLNYASGSLLELTVSGSKKRPKTAILNPIILIDKESGKSMVHLDFDNQSSFKGRLFMEAHLRHKKRLIAKIPLFTHQSIKSNMLYSLVFPNNLVHTKGEIEKTLEPGDYEMRVVGKFNGVRLRSFNHKFSIDNSGQSVGEDETAETTKDPLKKES
jgi:hypothetical protein